MSERGERKNLGGQDLRADAQAGGIMQGIAGVVKTLAFINFEKRSDVPFLF